MGVFNWLSKIGHKTWNGLKKGVGVIYKPIKKIVHGVGQFKNMIDDVLTKVSHFPIAHELVDLIRDNPLYRTITDTIDDVGDLVENKLPEYGKIVENFVEHNVFKPNASSYKDNKFTTQPVNNKYYVKNQEGMTYNRAPAFNNNLTNISSF